MVNGKLKIKERSKVELKVNGKDMSIPKEYDFSALAVGSYECEVNLDNGKLISIVVNGKAIPKNDLEVQRKEEQAKKREQEELARKEQEKKEKETQRHQTNPQSQGNRVSDCFDLSLSQIPADTKKLFLEDSDNFALKFYKFARFEKNENDASKSKFQFFKTDRGKIVYETRHNNYGLGSKDEANNKIKRLAQTHKNSVESLFTDGGIKSQNFKPDWRVIIGIGTDSIYETGITLHHIYGFPYIPASAIKGITNHYAQDNGFDKKENKSKQWYDDIFGTTSQKGKITFFDAMPLTIPELKPDIMNVHYPDYYGGNSAPTDTQSPRPILYLTVENTEFQFMLGSKEDNKQLLETTFTWLKEAIQNKGIGAKTAVGYGYFKE